jgi:CheY-like chemotaxis protein
MTLGEVGLPVKLVRQLKPYILLLDLAMPKHSGLQVLGDLSSAGNGNYACESNVLDKTPVKHTPVRVILLTAAVLLPLSIECQT